MRDCWLLGAGAGGFRARPILPAARSGRCAGHSRELTLRSRPPAPSAPVQEGCAFHVYISLLVTLS